MIPLEESAGTLQALVGEPVQWVASSDSEHPGSLRYRFSVSQEGAEGTYEAFRDFGPEPAFTWAATDHEGFYILQVTTSDLMTGEITSTSARFEAVTRLAGNRPQVNATEYPNLFLFSAPPCPAEGRMRVTFHPASGGATQATAYKDCTGATSMNFYLAGLNPDTDYVANASVEEKPGAAAVAGPAVTFRSGEAIDTGLPRRLLQMPAVAQQQTVLLHSNGYATDLYGTMLWSLNPPPVTQLTRPAGGGLFWGVFEDTASDAAHQYLRKFDLAGMVIRETNAEQVNRQLVARGKRPIGSFHHEASQLPDGRVVTLASVEQILTDTPQGKGDVNVIGDMILVLDENMNVLWAWDTFDWLDIGRVATMNETCRVGTGGCPPFYLTAEANDWTHGNSVQLTPDGDLIYSARHQDWLIKIDYANGDGDGHIVWKLGRGGDFTLVNGKDSWPWFSHQHDANFDSAGELLVFDNGNTRWFETGGAESRGQVFVLNEDTRTATLKLNANLGVLAAAVGSAQKLADGNYHFEAGYVIQPDNSLAAFALETDASGRILYNLETRGLVYRSFRMADLYTAP